MAGKKKKGKGKKKKKDGKKGPTKPVIPNFIPLNPIRSPIAVKIHHFDDVFLIYSDEYNPARSIVVEICKILNVTPNQIYGWDECKELTDFLATQKKLLNHFDDLIRQRDELDSRIREYAHQLRTSKYRNSNDL